MELPGAAVSEFHTWPVRPRARRWHSGSTDECIQAIDFHKDFAALFFSKGPQSE
jgi:hypothetical protein